MSPGLLEALSPEACLITLCVREPDVAPPAGEPKRAVADVRNWEGVVALAARHGVVGYLRQAATRTVAPVPVPETARTLLQAATLSVLARTLQLDAELQRVVAALAEAGQPVIVLKGPVLARTIYSNAALRPYTDVDVTVQDRHEAASANVLRELGFAERFPASRQWWQAHGHHVHEGAALHRVFFGSGQTEALVELHTDPLQLGLRPTCEAARWQRAVPVPNLPGALMLAPEDQLVQLSVHVHKHGFSRLIWLKDLDLMVRAYEGRLDWDLVQSVARAEGVGASVWLALQLAGQLLGARLPEPVLARLRPPLATRTLYGAVWPTSRIAALDGRMRRRAVQFSGAESWRGAVPGLVLMGRRPARARAFVQSLIGRAVGSRGPESGI